MTSIFNFFLGEETSDKQTNRECRRELRRMERDVGIQSIDLKESLNKEKERMSAAWISMSEGEKKLAAQNLLMKQDDITRNAGRRMNLEALKRHRQQQEDTLMTERIAQLSYVQMRNSASQINPRVAQKRAIEMERLKMNAEVSKELLMDSIESCEDGPENEIMDDRVSTFMKKMDEEVALKISTTTPTVPTSTPVSGSSKVKLGTILEDRKDVELELRLKELKA